MSFFHNLYSSFEDKVAEVADPRELIKIWEAKKREKKPKDLAVVEARLAEVLADVSDVLVFEKLIVLVDAGISDWFKQVREVLLTDDDHHVSALGERGVLLKHLIALAETPNIYRAALAESLIKKIGGARPDLARNSVVRNAITNSSDETTRLFTVLESRLLEILVKEISGIDDISVLAGLFDLATLGEGGSDFRILKSRELIVDRICVVINQINDIAQLKDLSVPQYPQIQKALAAKIQSLLFE